MESKAEEESKWNHVVHLNWGRNGESAGNDFEFPGKVDENGTWRIMSSENFMDCD